MKVDFRILINSTVMTLLVAAMFSLSGCNSGGLSGTGAGAAKYVYRFLPSSLIVELPDNLVVTDANTSGSLSPLQVFQQLSLPSARVSNLTNQLDIMNIDAAFEQIQNYCQSVAVDEVCVIPSGEVYYTFTQAMANTQKDLVLAAWRLKNHSQQVIDEGLADLDVYHSGLIGDLTPLNATKFTKLNGLPYDYNVKQLRGSIFTILEDRVTWSFSWTEDKTKAQLYDEAIIDGDYTISYSFYQEHDNGNTMVSRNHTESDSGASVTKLTIKERQDGKQGVNIRASASTSYANTDERLFYNLEAVDNSEGGYSITHIESASLGAFNTRETIDAAGTLLDYEVCVDNAASNPCDNNENWFGATNFESRGDIQDSEFFTIYNAIEDFSSSIDQAGIFVENLPETTQSFVIAEDGFPEKREALMCSGQRSAGEIVLQCGIDAETLLKMDVYVFEEVVENSMINFQLLDEALVAPK